MNPTANETALGRTTAALAEALDAAGIDDRWMAAAVRGVAAHLAAELIVLEQQAGHPLSLQDGARFLAAIGEGQA